MALPQILLNRMDYKGLKNCRIDILMAFRYYYKYITNGQWRHSTSSPAERDDRGNVNNVIVIGDTASVRPSVQPQKKVSFFFLF